MPQPAKDLTKNPLYAELLAIGTKDKTMNVAVLEKYDNLLESPEVLRRAKSETTRTARARSAQDALQAAIASIVAQGIREVAEAALCSTEAFEGLQINARVLKLPGVTIRTFTRRRTEAFEDIVRFLNRDASAT